MDRVMQVSGDDLVDVSPMHPTGVVATDPALALTLQFAGTLSDADWGVVGRAPAADWATLLSRAGTPEHAQALSEAAESLRSYKEATRRASDLRELLREAEEVLQSHSAAGTSELTAESVQGVEEIRRLYQQTLELEARLQVEAGDATREATKQAWSAALDAHRQALVSPNTPAESSILRPYPPLEGATPSKAAHDFIVSSQERSSLSLLEKIDSSRIRRVLIEEVFGKDSRIIRDTEIRLTGKADFATGDLLTPGPGNYALHPQNGGAAGATGMGWPHLEVSAALTLAVADSMAAALYREYRNAPASFEVSGEEVEEYLKAVKSMEVFQGAVEQLRQFAHAHAISIQAQVSLAWARENSQNEYLSKSDIDELAVQATPATEQAAQAGDAAASAAAALVAEVTSHVAAEAVRERARQELDSLISRAAKVTEGDAPDKISGMFRSRLCAVPSESPDMLTIECSDWAGKEVWSTVSQATFGEAVTEAWTELLARKSTRGTELLVTDNSVYYRGGGMEVLLSDSSTVAAVFRVATQFTEPLSKAGWSADAVQNALDNPEEPASPAVIQSLEALSLLAQEMGRQAELERCARRAHELLKVPGAADEATGGAATQLATLPLECERTVAAAQQSAEALVGTVPNLAAPEQTRQMEFLKSQAHAVFHRSR